MMSSPDITAKTDSSSSSSPPSSPSSFSSNSQWDSDQSFITNTNTDTRPSTSCWDFPSPISADFGTLPTSNWDWEPNFLPQSGAPDFFATTGPANAPARSEEKIWGASDFEIWFPRSIYDKHDPVYTLFYTYHSSLTVSPCLLPQRLPTLLPPSKSRIVTSTPGIRFEPPMRMLRRSAILEILRTLEPKPTSLLDIGCGQKFFLLKALGACDDEIPLERVYGLDIDDQLLEKAEKEITAAKLGQDEERGDRWRSLEYNILHGSFEGLTKDLVDGGVHVIVSCELVQHLHQETLEKLPEVVLGGLRPEIWIVTTVNREFSALYDVPLPMEFGLLDKVTNDQRLSGFGITEKGHRFEWDRKEFQDWCVRVASQWGYGWEFSGTGAVKQGLCFGEVEEEAAMVEDSLKKALGLEGEFDREALVKEAGKIWGSRTQVVVFKRLERGRMEHFDNFVECQTTFPREITNLNRSAPSTSTSKPLSLDVNTPYSTPQAPLADATHFSPLPSDTSNVKFNSVPKLIHTLKLPRAHNCLPYPPSPTLTASLLASSLLPFLPERLSLFWTDPGHTLRLEPAEAWNKYDSARDRRHAEQLQGLDMAAIRTVRRLVGREEVWKSAGSVRKGWRWKEDQWRRFVDNMVSIDQEEWVFDEKDFRGLSGSGGEAGNKTDGSFALVAEGDSLDCKVEESLFESTLEDMDGHNISEDEGPPSPYSTGSHAFEATYAKGGSLFPSTIDLNPSCFSDYGLEEAMIPSSWASPTYHVEHSHEPPPAPGKSGSQIRDSEITAITKDACVGDNPQDTNEHDNEPNKGSKNGPDGKLNEDDDDTLALPSSPPGCLFHEATQEGSGLIDEEPNPEDVEADNESKYSYQLTIPTWETIPLVAKLTATLRFIPFGYDPPLSPTNAPADDQTLIYDTRKVDESGKKEAGIEVVFRLKNDFWFDDFLGEGVVSAPEGQLGQWVRVGEEAGGRWEWVE